MVRPQLIGRTCRRVLKTIASRTGATPDLLSDTRSLSTLMWSHYAKNHTGICLEFHVSNHLFLKAMPVSYEIKYPQFHIDTMYEHATQVVLTKADCWRYEDEFRLIASPDLAIDNPLRLHDGMYLRLPLPSLLSVIVGCKGDYAQVKSVVDKHSPGMRVIRIVRANDEYQLAMAINPDS